METYGFEVEKSYRQATEHYETLVHWLLSKDTGELRHDEVESKLEEDGREICRRLFEACLNRCGEMEAVEDVKGEDGVNRTHVRLRMRTMETLSGTVEVWRNAHDKPGVESLMPVDGYLNLPPEK